MNTFVSTRFSLSSISLHKWDYPSSTLNVFLPGGSIRVYAMKGKHQMSARAKELLATEKKAGLYDVKAHKKFAERIILAKHDLVALLLKVKKQGARIAGLGSPARANTLWVLPRLPPTF